MGDIAADSVPINEDDLDSALAITRMAGKLGCRRVELDMYNADADMVDDLVEVG